MKEDKFKRIEEIIRKQMLMENRTPVEDFDNLSPEDMQLLVYSPFREGCCVQYKNEIPNEVLDQCSFFRLVETLLEEVKNTKEIKLTARGNLPVKLVKSLYEQGFIAEDMIEKGIIKLYKEEDSFTITNAKLMLETIGATKKRNGKWSLTKKGEKWAHPQNRELLFKEVFETYSFKYNWGYHDGHPDEANLPSTLGFSIYLFLTYGDQPRLNTFYSQKVINAYPHLVEHFPPKYRNSIEIFQDCYRLRLIERFFKWFDLLTVFEQEKNDHFKERSEVQNKLLTAIFEIRNENFQFIKPELND